MSKKQYTIDYDVESYGFCGDTPVIGNVVNKYDDGKFLTCHFLNKDDTIGFCQCLRNEGYEEAYDVDMIHQKLKEAKKEYEEAKKNYEGSFARMSDKQYTIKDFGHNDQTEICKYIDGEYVSTKIILNGFVNGYCLALESEGFYGAHFVNAAYEKMMAAKQSYERCKDRYEVALIQPLIKN